MHDTHEVTGSTPVSPTIPEFLIPLPLSLSLPKKTKFEWVVIILLGTLFATIWLFAHWNLSRQPPHHKGPGSVGYEEPALPPSDKD